MIDEREAKEVFLGALEVEPEERSHYLDGACGGKEELRGRVERLIEAYGTPTRGGEATTGNLDGLPEEIAGYRLIRQLGAGGMGVVYEAWQERPRRHVALKIVGPIIPASETAQRRFEYEADILARMRHPGIAQVYASGGITAGGRRLSYLAMELVPEALAVTVFARQRELGWRECAALIAEACAAVHHAHLRGVIHRDLKPANLLVDGEGRIKLIDFGVARVCAGEDAVSVLTIGAQVVGTVQYMSPEQCEGDARDVDARTDVYSLGAVLYELVCGHAAHDLSGLSVIAALRRVREETLQAPRTAHAGVPRNLEAVILKAMSRRREDRYGSAPEMEQDLRRLLAGEPVSARPPWIWARVVRRAARHPVAATVALCGLLVCGSLGGTLVGIRVLATRPDHLVLAQGSMRVSLESRAGHRLAAWDCGEAGNVIMWAMLDRPREVGGGRVIVLGFDHRCREEKLAGNVTGIDPNRPTEIMWTTAAFPLLPPGDYGERRQATLTLDLAFVADVFPDSPGREIVMIQSMYPYSASVIRVVDLQGRLRYEVWHEGALGTGVWLQAAGLLVLAGVNSERRWDERGHALESGRYPTVVFALRPSDGHVASRRWVVFDGKRGDTTMAWYRWLGPPERLGPLNDVYATLAPPGAGWDSGRYVQAWWSCGRTDRARRAGFTLLLDEHGKAIDRWDDDDYKSSRAAGEVPGVEVYRLLEYEELPTVENGDNKGG